MDQQYKNIIEGRCHCGNVHLELHTDRDEHELTPRTCQCSYCRSHGASWISDPGAEVRLRFDDREQVTFYRFGHKTSDFVVCRNCGVPTIAICELEGRLLAVVNTTAMTDRKFTAPPAKPDFDQETVDSRLERRGRNWIGNVIIEE